VRKASESAGEGAEPPSKTQRKAQMHALQDLGEAMVDLEPRQLAGLFAQVELPERLREAIIEARAITAWGGRKRQLQFVGRLMREIDPEPIERWLDALAQGRRMGAARQHALERWRERLLGESEALDELCAAHPTLDRSRFRALIAKARDERAAATPPHAYRELFRALDELLADDKPA
jgi:ribosome-associated protein